MSLGRTIRAMREYGDITQKELAQSAGIDQSYLSMLESGRRQNPGLRTVARLARALHVPIDELSAGAGLMPRSQTPDLLSEKAMRLFDQLPSWRQQDVVSQLEMYVRLGIQLAPPDESSSATESSHRSQPGDSEAPLINAVATSGRRME